MIDKLKLKYDEFKKKGLQGEILRQGQKMLERIHLNTSEMRSCKDGMAQAKKIYDYQIDQETKRLASMEKQQIELKAAYDFTLQYIGQQPHFSPPVIPPPPVKAEPPKDSIVEKIKKKKKILVEKEVDEE